MITGERDQPGTFRDLFGGSRDDGEPDRRDPGLILAPIAATMLQPPFRSRAYEADRLGAELCGKPSHGKRSVTH